MYATRVALLSFFPFALVLIEMIICHQIQIGAGGVSLNVGLAHSFDSFAADANASFADLFAVRVNGKIAYARYICQFC